MSYGTIYRFSRFTIVKTLSFYEGIRDLEIKELESEVFCTDYTALFSMTQSTSHPDAY